MEKILLAGATGYLGKYIAKELVNQKYFLRVLVRNSERFKQFGIPANEIINAEVTNKSTLANCCNDIDVVISTVGITKQKDRLTYMDVDYQANLNLLEEAGKSGVKKLIYVSVLNGEALKETKICCAKELFVEKLKNSGIEYCVVRPNGFYSDIAEFLKMAKKGHVYLFGNGELKSNPIHGEDLAKVCVSVINSRNKEIEVGGTETLTQNQIAEIAFDALGKKTKIIHLPDWIRNMALNISKLLLSEKSYGPIEFFLTVMGIEMVAPEYGNHTLLSYFKTLITQ
jgi:uncharacterized protein YbjT (DUF2867 family)